MQGDAADIQREMDVPPGEPNLLMVLAGGVSLHQAPRLLGWIPGVPLSLVEGPLLPRLLLALLALSIPALLYGLAWLVFSRQRLRRTLYGLLPLIWALLLTGICPWAWAKPDSCCLSASRHSRGLGSSPCRLGRRMPM